MTLPRSVTPSTPSATSSRGAGAPAGSLNALFSKRTPHTRSSRTVENEVLEALDDDALRPVAAVDAGFQHKLRRLHAPAFGNRRPNRRPVVVVRLRKAEVRRLHDRPAPVLRRRDLELRTPRRTRTIRSRTTIHVKRQSRQHRQKQSHAHERIISHLRDLAH